MFTDKMDVAAFSDENFNPKDWINKALKTSDPTQTKVGINFVLLCFPFYSV